MATSTQTVGPKSRRRARVVLRASGKRHQIEVSEGSETCDSASEPEGQLGDLTTTTHYDHSALGWTPHSLPRASKRGGGRTEELTYEPLDETISSNVFQEKLEFSRDVLHSTPFRPHPSHPTIQYPMPPGGVSSTIFHEYQSTDSQGSNSSDCDGEDDVFLGRPKTAPVLRHTPGAKVKVHPKAPPHVDNSSALSSSLPSHPNPTSPSSCRQHTTPQSTSSETSPFHAKDSQRRKGRWAWRTSHVHPAGLSPRQHSTSPNRTSQLLSTDTISSVSSSTVAPLLTSQLRKGGRRPSVDTKWDFSGEEQLESCFPDRHIRVFVTTWNMHEEKELPECLDDLLLPLSHELAADVYVIGTQESTPSRSDWELLIQQTLGPSHVLVHSASLGVILLLLFIRRDIIWFCSSVRSAGYTTRPITPIKTKGGLGLSLTLFGTSFLFITSHFTAHQQKVAERNSDMQRIAANLDLSDGSGALLDAFDHVFWLGDLNYRLELDRDVADQHIASADWMSLLLHDQLTREILLGNVFHGFSEQPITFPPSYKLDLNSDVYDSSEKRRIPSWTDRILFKSSAGTGAITGCGYDSCRTLSCSDHRPVYAVFRAKLDPCSNIDGMPDSVVTFDRTVFMKAHQLRKQAAQLSLSLRGEEGTDAPSTHLPSSPSHVSSSFCIIL